MIVTIFYLPLVLPYLLEGASVSSWDIAKSLIMLMLIPLVIALSIRAYHEKIAGKLQFFLMKITNIALVTLAVSLVVLHTKAITAMIGLPLLSIIALLVLAMAIGYIMGGRNRENRVVMALGTGQRNISAAVLVAAQNFEDPEIISLLVAVAIIGLFIMIPYAKWVERKAH